MTEKLTRLSYVEDEPDIRAVAELALMTLGGFDIDVCVDGQEAVRKIPVFKPQLILLDVMMPGLDGLQTMTALREIPETAKTPIIFMTAKAQRNEIQHYIDLGAIDVIPKPFDPMLLPQSINSIWDRFLEQQAA
ncbi:MAG: response regulator [Rhodobacteraceae bacterium]|nr:response regulator [Paracoccaceae bacterium]